MAIVHYEILLINLVPKLKKLSEEKEVKFFLSDSTLDMFLISKFLLHRFANTTYFEQHRYSMLPNCFPTDTLKKVYMLCCQNSIFIIASFCGLRENNKTFQ